MTLGCLGGSPCLHGCHAAIGGCTAGSSSLHGRHVKTDCCAAGNPCLYDGHVLPCVRLCDQGCWVAGVCLSMPRPS